MDEAGCMISRLGRGREIGEDFYEHDPYAGLRVDRNMGSGTADVEGVKAGLMSVGWWWVGDVVLEQRVRVCGRWFSVGHIMGRSRLIVVQSCGVTLRSRKEAVRLKCCDLRYSLF